MKIDFEKNSKSEAKCVWRTDCKSSFDAFADAFADEKNYFLIMQLMLSIVAIYSYMQE